MIDDRDRPSPDWTRPPEPPIHRAARKGDLEELQRLLDAGANIEERADLEHDNGPHLNGLTPLMIAARSIDGASVETLRWLVERGADIHATSEGGNTAAWYAAGDGGRWPFHAKAVTPDHVRRLAFLLDQGLDPRERNFVGRSLLTEACAAGDVERVRLLLDRGVPVEEPASDAPKGPSLRERMESLLGDLSSFPGVGSPDVPRGDRSSFEIPIFCAAESGSAECVRLLIERGTDPNVRDDSACTPIMSAGSVDVVRVLLEAGADRDATDEYGIDALDTILKDSCAAGACGPERFAVARALIDAGADIERCDESGQTRLASAAFAQQADSVEFLLKLGASPTAPARGGDSALHSICWQGEYTDPETKEACARIIRALVAAGVPVDAVDDHGATPMHEATDGDWGNVTAVRTLLELGAAADPADSDGETPLLLAARRGELACIEVLLAAGADPARVSGAGESPIDAARDHLKSWSEIVAEGPDGPTAAIVEMHESIAEAIDFGGGDDDEFDAEAMRDEVDADHRSALDTARRSLEALERHAGTRDA